MDSSLSRENGVVKSRSLLGHFHHLRFASGSQKAHRLKEYLRLQTDASGNRTGFYNSNNNHKTNGYEQYTICSLPLAAWQRE